MDNDAIVSMLNKVLADQHVLYVKTRNAHWNLVGKQFHDLHKLFEEQYDGLAEAIDMVAEHLRFRGGTAAGSMKEYLALARLSEAAGKVQDGVAWATLLLADHEAVVAQLRKDVAAAGEMGDDATQDMLIELLRGHEKTAWMLRSVTA